MTQQKLCPFFFHCNKVINYWNKTSLYVWSTILSSLPLLITSPIFQHDIYHYFLEELCIRETNWSYTKAIWRLRLFAISSSNYIFLRKFKKSKTEFWLLSWLSPAVSEPILEYRPGHYTLYFAWINHNLVITISMP